MNGLFDLPEALPAPEKEVEVPLPEGVVKTTGCLEWHKREDTQAIEAISTVLDERVEVICYDGISLYGGFYVNGCFYIDCDEAVIQAYCIIPQAIKDFLKCFDQ